MKICKVCKTEFNPRNSLQKVCSIQCAKRYAQNKECEKKAKESRKNLAIRKDALKTVSQLQAEAQTAVNRYIRARDAGLPCISCGRSESDIIKEQGWKTGGAFDAGHYISRGANKSLRYVLHNIHKQCKSCNGGSGKYSSKRKTVDEQYRENLVAKIGLVKVEELEADQKIRKQNYNVNYLKRLKRIFNKKTRIVKKYKNN